MEAELGIVSVYSLVQGPRLTPYKAAKTLITTEEALSTFPGFPQRILPSILHGKPENEVREVLELGINLTVPSPAVS